MSAAQGQSSQLYTFKDVLVDPYPVEDCKSVSSTPLVLDNGCWKARLGLVSVLKL